MSMLRTFVKDLQESAKCWSNDNIMLHSSSLAYYTVFSIAPLLVIAIAVAGFFFGEDATQGKIFGEIQGLMGSGGATAVQSMVKSANTKPSAGIFATVLGVVVLLIGASGVFAQLQESLNLIWDIQAPPNEGFIGWLKRRVFTFAMIGVISFLLLVSLIASAIVTAADDYLGTSAIWGDLNFVVSISFITLLFASVYKFLPEVKLQWRYLWLGSFISTLFFTLGKWLIGLYIAKTSVASSYGAAGSLVVLLTWVYYSAMIFYFGAEFIKVRAKRNGHEIEAKAGAGFRTKT